MLSPRTLSETTIQKDEGDRRVKELKTNEQRFFWHSIHEHRMQDIYNMLLKNHVHPDVEIWESGYSPLYVACFFGHLDIAEFLIMNGARLDGPPHGFVPLFGNLNTDNSVMGNCVELLLDHKANANVRLFDGSRPLMFAIHNSKATKLLLDHQADVNAIKRGKTALDFAKEQNVDPEVIGLLEAATKLSDDTLNKNIEKEEETSESSRSYCAMM